MVPVPTTHRRSTFRERAGRPSAAVKTARRDRRDRDPDFQYGTPDLSPQRANPFLFPTCGCETSTNPVPLSDQHFLLAVSRANLEYLGVKGYRAQAVVHANNGGDCLWRKVACRLPRQICARTPPHRRPVADDGTDGAVGRSHTGRASNLPPGIRLQRSEALQATKRGTVTSHRTPHWQIRTNPGSGTSPHAGTLAPDP